MKPLMATNQGQSSVSRIAKVESAWAEFWFGPVDTSVLKLTRMMVGAVACFLFLCYGWIGRAWFTDQGWFDSKAAAFLVGDGIAETGAEFRISPFYKNPNLVLPVAAVGTIASIMIVLGRFSSIASAVAFLCLMFFHQRAPLLVTVSEPLISAFLFYFALVPTNLYQSQRGYFATIGLRLVQVHFVIWIGFSLASMLANEGWWTGESVRRLLEDRQGLIPASWGTPLVAECLASLVLITQVIFLVCVARSSWRSYGFWAMLVFVVAILLILADWMYALTMFAGLSSLSMLPERLTKRYAVPT